MCIRDRDMTSMFLDAKEFDGDISKWDVSSVNKMDRMFMGAKNFKQKLCEAAWFHSKASNNFMFEGSSGSMSQTVCEASAVFKPKSKVELKNAVGAYIKLCPEGCSDDPHGPIGTWDVSRITDMSHIFFRATSFNGDISKWDVSRVTDMSSMFSYANSFNGDLSKWDVSSVKDMTEMFLSLIHI